MFRIEDEIAPIGPVKNVLAKSLEDLRQALNHLAKTGFDMSIGWHGWDDGSIIGHCSKPSLFIESTEG